MCCLCIYKVLWSLPAFPCDIISDDTSRQSTAFVVRLARRFESVLPERLALHRVPQSALCRP